MTSREGARSMASFRRTVLVFLVFMEAVQICSGVRAALRLRKKSNSADDSEDEELQDEMYNDAIYDKASIFEQGCRNPRLPPIPSFHKIRSSSGTRRRIRWTRSCERLHRCQ
ncbi:Protein CBG26761 [Caenorhabditis briggsae]|uniref:Protein CBG26761 n=1 Tax=Caenorhabditis briggsae TaxID=6238 RepID=H8WHC5_CAEBR|nr:Protein CBG26761 [Caenorhabditis briggsae]CCG58650.1 Protein CBG26761 [Caenorhabditis briggsae]